MSTTTEHARKVIAGNVRAVLGRRRSNQTQLAEVLGKSQAAVSRRLNADLPFDTDELLLICDYYEVPLSTLLEDVDRLDDGSPRIHGVSTWIHPTLFDADAWFAERPPSRFVPGRSLIAA